MKKTVVITGGTKGIGADIARAFIEKGYYVMLGARHDNGLAKMFGERAKFTSLDIRELESHRNAIRMTIDWTGQLDAYVNNAGFSEWRGIDQVDEQFWTKMIDTNLKGAYWGCKAAAKDLKNGGAIVNISSLAGKRGSANNSVYCASKFGVNGLTQSLAKELGPRGIRVNAVCPVYIKSPGLMTALQDKQSPANGQDIDGYLQKFSQEAALKRLPTGLEVAALTYFLASNDASGITGQCINVDCGVLLS